MPSTPVLRRRRLAVACCGAVLAGTALLVACAEQSPSTKDITDALVTSGVPKDQAACTAKGVRKALTAKQLQQLVDRGQGGTPVDDPKDPNDAADRLRDAIQRCRDLAPTTTTDPVPTTVTLVPTTAVPSTDGAKIDSTPSTTAP